MMAEKIGQYLIDDDYRIHRVPGYEKPISLIDKENPRLPFYGVYPATIEMLPIPQRQEFEKRILTETDLQSQNKMYWVFWFNKNTENMADKQLNEWKKQNPDTQILGWKYAMSNYNHSICI